MDIKRIRVLVDEMKTRSVCYDENARLIADLLTDADIAGLAFIINAMPPVYDGPTIKDPLRQELVECGLATRSTFNGNEGYTRITFGGYAVYRQWSMRKGLKV